MSANNLPVIASVTAPETLPTLIPLEHAHPGISFQQLWAIICAYRLQICAITFTVIAVTTGIVKLMPKFYTAGATMMVNYEVSDPVGGKEIPEGLLGNFMATQAQLMQSPEVLFPVIDKLKLTQDEAYTAGYKNNGGTLRDWVMTQLQKDLLIAQGQGAGQLIYISATADSPEKAMLIANGIGDTYSEQERTRSAGQERMRRYSEQLAELKSNITAAQDRLSEYRRRTGITDAAVQDSAETQALAALEQQLLNAQNERRAAEVKAASDQSVDSSVMGSMLIQGMKSQLATQESQLAQLGATLGPRHPKYVELESQIKMTRQALTKETQNYAGSNAAELQAARQLEQKQQQAVDERRKKVLSVRDTLDEGSKLQLELDSAQTLYKRALDGYDQILFASDRDPNVRFVSRALLPVKASRPNKLKFVILGVVVGAFLGLLGPLCYELLFRRRIRCRDDVERDLGIPVLAEFNVIKLAGAT